MKIAVILPAAGVGKRFATGLSEAQAAAILGGVATGTKIEADLAGRPVFMRAIDLFVNRPEVGQILLAVHPDRVEEFAFRHGDRLAFHNVTIVAGGVKERWETVSKVLRQVDADCTHVAIHDAARPLTSDALIRRVFEAAATYDAVIPGLAVSSTLKRTRVHAAPADPMDDILGHAGKTVAQVRQVVQTVDRSDLVEVQTPQVFKIELLRQAYAGLGDGSGITDDAGLVEAMGQPVYVVEGESTNLKITRREDLQLASAILGLNQSASATASRRKLLGDDDE